MPRPPLIDRMHRLLRAGRPRQRPRARGPARPAAALLALLLAAAALPRPARAADMLRNLAGADYAIAVTSMQQARRAGTLIQQYDFSCGSAAIATLLTHHYGMPVTEQAVFEQMYLHGDQQKIRREGFSLLDMKRFLASRGLEADGFAQPLDKLAEARVPAIALIVENGYHHFVVVKGLRDDRVLVGDPAQGTRAMPRHIFEGFWKNRLLFVIHNRMDLARFDRPEDWRVAPRGPLAAGLAADGLAHIALPKFGPGDF
ncbi:MAG: C39 family peptidase [Xylophilus ampelinus]